MDGDPTPREVSRELRRARERLAETGLLLEADARLPSLAALVAGEPVRGSWWGHPRGRAIYAVSTALRAEPDVLAVKLVNGKVTFVERGLWPSLYSVATAGEAWQTRGLSAEARRLLERVRARGCVEASGDAARALERRLLVRATEVHTASGAHAKALERWERWRRAVGLRAPRADAAAGRGRLERAVEPWRREAGVRVELPWGRAGRG